MQLSDKKIWLYGLFVACPEGTPMPDCPLEQYRSLPEIEKVEIIENFTEEDVDEIIKHHNHCLLHRV